ncbi:HPr family phosphocarrier protein [Collinsella sp. An2]|uniref:HPr family phosphocarrier protein n=1 Tax=Collinsella sp. An2 TaxID=1965585 RepID=UPI000B3A0F8D|nr:HPr family phosphocarrier protein [Collinsella sp. An2]OUP09478.1 hypothetical protein B5F33_04750 [Collinsella sp. An2]
MVEFTHVIQSRAGLHARPVAEIGSFAGSYEGKITVALSGVEVAATDIMGLMSLNASQGDTLHITVEGPEEEDAAVRLRTTLAACL